MERCVKKKKIKKMNKYAARVAHVGHVCDLALLEIEDEANSGTTSEKFWSNTTPLIFSEVLPSLQATAFALGYPAGGDTICVTKGVISRVGLIKYFHSSRSLPTIQFDAAINEGSSGGPVMQKDHVIGMCLQALEDKQNIGYCVPSVVINHFLTDCFVHKRVANFPKLGFSFINLENPSHKKQLGLSDEQTGVLIRSLTPLTDAKKKLEVGDVLLEYDGVVIADDGTIPNLLRDKKDDIGERVEFTVLASLKFKHEKCRLKIWRNQQMQWIDVNVFASSSLLVPLHLYYLSDNEMREHKQRYEEGLLRSRHARDITPSVEQEEEEKQLHQKQLRAPLQQQFLQPQAATQSSPQINANTSTTLTTATAIATTTNIAATTTAISSETTTSNANANINANANVSANANAIASTTTT
ncbi:hypothetical protein RFI_25199, partial [Reticulomyxa filosa]